MSIRHALTAGLLLAALLCGSCARLGLDRHDTVQGQASWTDRAASQDFQTAREQTYEPYVSAFTRSDAASAYWIRLELNPRDEKTGPWVLRLRSRNRPRISVHTEPGQDCAEAGALDPEAISLQTRSLLGWFTIPLCPSTNRVYLRLTADAEPTLQTQVLRRAEAESRDLGDAATLYVVIGALGLAFLLALGQAFSQRSRLAASLLTQLAGFNAYLVSQLTPNPASALAGAHDLLTQLDLRTWRGLMVLGTIYFLRTWLQTGKPERRSVRWLDIPIAMAALALPLSLASVFELSEILSAFSFMVALPVAAVLALTASQPWMSQRLPSLLVVCLAWLSALAIYQRVDPQSAAPTALLFHGLVSGIVLARLVKSSREAIRISTEQRMEANARADTRELLLMLAHELRTPLSVIRLTAESPFRSESMAQRASTAIQEMDLLIERCLQTAGLDGTATSEMTSLSLASELPSMLARWQDDTRLQVQLEPELPAVRANITLLALIVGVLLENASRYGSPEDPILVTARTSMQGGRQGVALVVSNGIGIAGVPDADKLFRKYYRSPQAHHLTGAGLGLYLARQLSHQMDAELALEPEHADRVSLRLWLPA